MTPRLKADVRHNYSNHMKARRIRIFAVISMLSLLCGCVEIDEISMSFAIDKDLKVLQKHVVRGFRPSSTYGPEKKPKTDEQIKEQMNNMYSEFEKDVSALRKEASEKGVSLDTYKVEPINTTDTRCDVSIEAGPSPISSLMPIYLSTRNFSVARTDKSLSVKIHSNNVRKPKKESRTIFHIQISYEGIISDHNGRLCGEDQKAICWDYDDFQNNGVYFALDIREK